ncbi:MAG: hypothetical protein ACOYT4_05060 [Nanoarchaeota archaeon]
MENQERNTLIFFIFTVLIFLANLLLFINSEIISFFTSVLLLIGFVFTMTNAIKIFDEREIIFSLFGALILIFIIGYIFLFSLGMLGAKQIFQLILLISLLIITSTIVSIRAVVKKIYFFGIISLIVSIIVGIITFVIINSFIMTLSFRPI